MAHKETLRRLVDHATPQLEEGLQLHSHDKSAPLELQLRMKQCGMATAALQAWMLQGYDVETERVIASPDMLPRELSSRHASHVVLRTQEGVYVDPTYTQFLYHVGLDHRAALVHDAVDLYPAQKIAVYTADEAHKFADDFAATAQEIEHDSRLPIDESYVEPHGALLGTSQGHKRQVYRQLWSPDKYESFPLEDQRQSFQDTARLVVQMMRNKK